MMSAAGAKALGRALSPTSHHTREPFVVAAGGVSIRERADQDEPGDCHADDERVGKSHSARVASASAKSYGGRAEALRAKAGAR